MADNDPPREAELAFLALQRRPKEYRAWAEEARAKWLREHPKAEKPLAKAKPGPRRPASGPLSAWGGIDEDD